MKKAFIAARHGEVDSRHNLSREGEQQIADLAVAIQTILKENPEMLAVYLMSSTAPRAVESSRILISALGISAERTGYHECFWEDDIHAGNNPLARKLVDLVLQDGNLVIVMGHAASLVGLVFHACVKLGAPCSVPDCAYGEAYLVTEEGVTIIPEEPPAPAAP